jgi:hypothetical protein
MDVEPQIQQRSGVERRWVCARAGVLVPFVVVMVFAGLAAFARS